MVKYTQILSSNSAFFSQKASKNLVAVFVGATNGIGLGALRAFAKHTSGASPTIYVVGRSQKSLQSIESSVASFNPSAKFVAIQANDLTVVKNALQAAAEIKSPVAKAEGKVDFLIMSPGYVSGQRSDNGEGLDRVQAIRYYSRMAFLTTLQPLLLKSSYPRVVTVLGAGTEGKLWADDLELNKNFGLVNAAGASASMMTLFLEEFQKQPGNDRMTLVHTFPGVVAGTGLTITSLPWWGRVLVDWVAPVLMNLFGSSLEQAGETVIYAATSPTFPAKADGPSEDAQKGSNGEVGSGVYLVQPNATVAAGNKVLTELRAEGLPAKVYEHTIDVLQKAAP